jgi:hypothetical protein
MPPILDSCRVPHSFAFFADEWVSSNRITSKLFPTDRHWGKTKASRIAGAVKHALNID